MTRKKAVVLVVTIDLASVVGFHVVVADHDVKSMMRQAFF